MKALRLRAGLVLLAGFAVLWGSIGPSPAYAAEEDLLAALEDYAAGRYDEALVKLREYVATNPGDDEVYAVLRDADEKVLLRVLAKQGEHERLLKYLLDKAQPTAREPRIEPAEVQELVDTAINNPDLDNRRRAGMKLTAAGAQAVPYMLPFLGRSDAEVVVNTMFALHRLGFSAVPPLVAALGSEDARVRGNAAAVLGDIRDAMAVPALLELKETDADEGVQAKAAAALEKIGGPRALEMGAAHAYTRMGERFYEGDPTVVMDFGDARNLWRWDGDLVRYEVPAYLYGYQVAEQMAVDALHLQPDLMRARVLLVRSLLAQKVEGDVIAADGGEAPEVLAGAFDLAATQGFDAATEALRQSLKERDWDVAIEAMHLVERTHGGESLTNHPLGAALIAPEPSVRYEAAITALRMSPQNGLPNADKVSHLAARAASERAFRQVLVIDDRDLTRNRLVMDLGHAGFVARSVANGAEGVTAAKSSPTLDVVIVRADLGLPSSTIPSRRHTSSIMVIDELKSDARTKDVRVIVLVEETMESKVDAVREFFETKYGDEIAGYVLVPIDTANAMETVQAAADSSELNAGRERANELAARAADAFARTDFSCSTFDLKVAVDPLATAAAEGPTPAVRLNAVRALGNIRLGGADALTTILSSSDEDEELRAAAATALGGVLSAQDATSEQVDALMAAAEGEGDVAKAALVALGQVRSLTAEQRRKVFEAHRLEVAQPAGM